MLRGHTPQHCRSALLSRQDDMGLLLDSVWTVRLGSRGVEYRLRGGELLATKGPAELGSAVAAEMVQESFRGCHEWR